MRTDTCRRCRELTAATRAYLHEYKCPLTADLTHHEINFAAATGEVAGDKTQSLPLQIFKCALLECASDRFRHAVPQKVVSHRMAQ